MIDAREDHCLEMLRQSSMCHADLSFTTFKWTEKDPRPMFDATESVHACIDWDVMLDSISQRVVAYDEIQRLENPLLRKSTANDP